MHAPVQRSSTRLSHLVITESSLCYVKASAPSHLLSATRPQVFENGPCFFHWGIPASVSFPIFLLHCYPCANKLLWRACLTLFSFTVPLFPAPAFPVVDGHLFSFPSDSFYHPQTVVTQHTGAKPNLLCTNAPPQCVRGLGSDCSGLLICSCYTALPANGEVAWSDGKRFIFWKNFGYVFHLIEQQMYMNISALETQGFGALWKSMQVQKGN